MRGRKLEWLRLLAVGLLATTALSACGTVTGSAGHFRKSGIVRAEHELNCDESELVLREVGRRQVGVSGCGRRAVYVYSSTHGWVNNTGGQID